MSDDPPIIVEGRMAVEAMLNSQRFDVQSLIVERERHAELVALAEKQDISVRGCSPGEIREAAGFDFHRGVFARAARPLGEEIPMDLLR